MSRVSKKDILHVAKLARIGVDDSEMEKYADEVIKIIDYVNMLDEVDVNDLQPTYSVGKNSSVMRKDEVRPSFDREMMLERAPHRDLVNIRTKGVFNE